MSAVFGLWHGGRNYAPGYVNDEGNLESFPSLQAAIDACSSRFHGQTLQSFYYLSGVEQTLCPMVDETSSMSVWLSDPRESDDPYPDYLIEMLFDGSLEFGAVNA